MKQINEVALLTPEQEKDLGWRIINDDDQGAKEHMIKANLRLVIAISKNYAHRGLALADLVEEGNIGLIRAVEGFDPLRRQVERGAEFWRDGRVCRFNLGFCDAQRCGIDGLPTVKAGSVINQGRVTARADIGDDAGYHAINLLRGFAGVIQ
jgi:hypothetical protein